MVESSRRESRVRKEVLEAREQAYFYPRGEGELKFNDNTSPFGPSPAVRLVMERSITDVIGGIGESTFYPDQNAGALRKAISDLEGVDVEGIVVGTGADELLDILFRVFVNQGDSVTIPVPAYFMYEHFASLNSARINSPHMGTPPVLPLPADSDSRIYIVSNPHNPTGTLFPERDILRLLDSFEGIVVVDEAYSEYSGKTMVQHVAKHPNLVVVRTFSKIHGLTNFRIGYSISSPDVAHEMRKVKNPFNVTTVSQALALAAVNDRNYVAEIRERVARERARLKGSLESLGFHVFDSSANFLLVDGGARVDALNGALKKAGVFVKRVEDAGYENCLRVTVRSEQENTEMLSRLASVMAKMK